MQSSRFCWHYVILSVILSVRTTHERVYGCGPNMAGVGKGWPSKTGYVLVLIRIRMWIYDHFSTFHYQIRHDTIYADSQEGATALLRDIAAALA